MCLFVPETLFDLSMSSSFHGNDKFRLCLATLIFYKGKVPGLIHSFIQGENHSLKCLNSLQANLFVKNSKQIRAKRVTDLKLKTLSNNNNFLIILSTRAIQHGAYCLECSAHSNAIHYTQWVHGCNDCTAHEVGS